MQIVSHDVVTPRTEYYAKFEPSYSPEKRLVAAAAPAVKQHDLDLLQLPIVDTSIPLTLETVDDQTDSVCKRNATATPIKPAKRTLKQARRQLNATNATNATFDNTAIAAAQPTHYAVPVMALWLICTLQVAIFVTLLIFVIKK